MFWHIHISTITFHPAPDGRDNEVPDSWNECRVHKGMGRSSSALPPNDELPLVHPWPRGLISETNQSSKISWSLTTVFKGQTSCPLALTLPVRKKTVGFKWLDIPFTFPLLPIAKPTPKPGFTCNYEYYFAFILPRTTLLMKLNARFVSSLILG
jgi:hypothetical protein